MRKLIAMTLSVLVSSLTVVPAVADNNALIDQSVMITCGDASGTGFYVDNGHIMTAKHVVTGCKTAEIISNTGIKTKATDFFLDPNFDIAILSAAKMIVKPVIQDSAESKLGETVFIVGSPIDGLVLSKGKIVESTGTNSPNRIYLDIPADHGNSGGPVFSNKGLIGMVTAKYEDGQVIAYNLKSLLKSIDLSKKAPGEQKQSPGLTATDNSSLPALQISIILNIFAFIFIVILLVRLRRNRQIVITLD